MKTALITGGGGYIGSTCAKTLALDGVQIAVCDINETVAQRAVDEIVAAGGVAKAYAIDVTDPANVEHCVEQVAADFGSLDMMIHVAGGTARIAGPDAKYLPLAEQEEYVIRRVVDVNLMGAIWCSRAAAKVMIRQGKGGKILNFSSVVGQNGLKDCVDYAAAKAGVVGMTRALAKELGQYKINVNSVAPGIVMRPDDMGGDARAFGTNFLGIKCLAQDVANVVEFLVSEKANFVTGQVYVVDGGRGLAMKGSD